MQTMVVKSIIRFSHRIERFRARGGYSGLDRLKPDANQQFAKSEIEFSDHEAFLSNLAGVDFQTLIAGKTVLDFGSGNGGRTVWLAKKARHVEGVEVAPSLVETSRAYARFKTASNVRFTLGGEDRLEYPDEHFDAIVSLDVLEHVQQPAAILRELYRVLKPGGEAIIIFTPWLGMFSHHLNYITVFPALHWFFSPRSIIAAVNELMASDSAFTSLGVSPQPDPPLSFNGRRRCLPTVNGMTKPEYLALVKQAGFEIALSRCTPILERWNLLGAAGRALNRGLTALPVADEMFSHNLVTVLRKPTG